MLMYYYYGIKFVIIQLLILISSLLLARNFFKKRKNEKGLFWLFVGIVSYYVPLIYGYCLLLHNVSLSVLN